MTANECSNPWHNSLSIRHETCPSCGGAVDIASDESVLDVVTDVLLADDGGSDDDDDRGSEPGDD